MLNIIISGNTPPCAKAHQSTPPDCSGESPIKKPRYGSSGANEETKGILCRSDITPAAKRSQSQFSGEMGNYEKAPPNGGVEKKRMTACDFSGIILQRQDRNQIVFEVKVWFPRLQSKACLFPAPPNHVTGITEAENRRLYC